MSFASLSLLTTSLQVVGVGDAVTQNVLQIKDFLFLWQPFALWLIHKNLVKKEYYKGLKDRNSKKQVFGTLIAGVIILVIFISTLSGLEISRFNKMWNREYIVMKFGLYTYQVNDIIKSVQPKINTMFGFDKANKTFREFYENQPKTEEPNEYTNKYEGKNLIVIHAESIQNLVLDQQFNGQDVAPNLKRLANEGIYFNNFYSQVSVGTSSDAEFTLSTSLLPVTNGTVFVSYWDRDFVTIPKLLNEKGYYSYSMHGNNASFWNRSAMHKEMGYDRFYAKSDYDVTEENTIGLGISDKEFFKQSIPKIQEVAKNHDKFYATVIMLSNHTPFDEVEKYGEFPTTMEYEKVNPETGETETATAPYMENTKLGNYFKSVHYADAAIGEFIQELDDAGLLDNTVIAIYGDHDARLDRSFYERLYNYVPETDSVKSEDDEGYVPVDYYRYEMDRRVPFIIWTKDDHQHVTNSNVMGMYDVLPTLGNMFNFKSEYALGHDIFDIKDKNIVLFPNGNWVTNDVYYNSQKEEYFSINNAPISQEEINKNNQYSDERIEVSNDIIVHDLIRKTEEAEKIKNKK